MKLHNQGRRQFFSTLGALGTGLVVGQVFGQEKAELKEPVFRTARLERRPDDHPLDPALRYAQDELEHIHKDIQDYECTIVKRERIKGVLNEYEYMYAKIRNRKITDEKLEIPLSVYLKFLKPANVAGREVIWVEQRNNGKLCAHEGGALLGRVSVWLDPNGPMAMKGNLYPISEIGLENLVAKLIERGSRERTADPTGEDTIVEFKPGAKLNGRKCTALSIRHDKQKPGYEFQLAQIFIDEELNIPIRYIAYGWPEKAGGDKLILEEYNYTDIKLNRGFTDADFDPRNPTYNYKGVGK